MNPSIRIGRQGMAALLQKSHDQNDLLTWTIYDHPVDFPDYYIVRPHSAALKRPLTVHFQHAQLEQVRFALAQLGLVCLARSDTDPPNVLEVWI